MCALRRWRAALSGVALRAIQGAEARRHAALLGHEAHPVGRTQRHAVLRPQARHELLDVDLPLEARRHPDAFGDHLAAACAEGLYKKSSSARTMLRPPGKTQLRPGPLRPSTMLPATRAPAALGSPAYSARSTTTGRSLLTVVATCVVW